VFVLGIPAALRKGKALGAQTVALNAVNLVALRDDERIRWQAYEAQLGRKDPLLPQQIAEVRSWPTR
jgi:hypothetical protein